VTAPAQAGRRVVVIGVGNEFRHDDGAGPAVVALLDGRVPDDVTLVVNDGEPTRMIEAWAGAHLAVVVDAVRAEPAVPGRLHRLVLDRAGAGPAAVSSHGLGLDEAVGLARALDRMPGRLIVHAVEGADLSQGTGLTPAVAAVIGTLAAAVLRDISPARQRTGGRAKRPGAPAPRSLPGTAGP
jgi:hydrogenase maturation protease